MRPQTSRSIEQGMVQWTLIDTVRQLEQEDLALRSSAVVGFANQCSCRSVDDMEVARIQELGQMETARMMYSVPFDVALQLQHTTVEWDV